MSSDVDLSGAIVAACDNDGPLAIAVGAGSVPIVLSLLSAGAVAHCPFGDAVTVHYAIL